MIPFWQVHSPAEIALEAMLDTIWVCAYVYGYCVALWGHFAAPAVPSVNPVDVALPYSELPTEAAPKTTKPKRTRKQKATVS